MAPVSASRTSGTPGPTPAPQRASVSHPHGRVPSFTSMLLNVVFDGIVNNQFTSLDIAYEHQTDLLARLQAKRLLSDDNIALFSSQSELVLSNCAITDKGIHKLFEKQDSRSIVGLHLENTNITDASLRLIAQFVPSIRLLDLSKCSQITEKGLMYILGHCKELRYLGLRDVLAVSDAVAASVLRLPNLVRVDLDGTYRLTDGLCKHLVMQKKSSLFGLVKKATQSKVSGVIEELSLSGCPLSPAALPSVIAFCPRLVSLNLSYCPQVTDNVLAEIMELTSPTLLSLALKATPGVSDASLPLFQSLDTLLLLENGQLTLPAIRNLVNDPCARVKVFGADLDISLLRNSLTRTPFVVSVNEFDTAVMLLDRVNAKLREEGTSDDGLVDLTSRIFSRHRKALAQSSASETDGFGAGQHFDSQEDPEDIDEDALADQGHLHPHAAARHADAKALVAGYKLRRVTYRKNGTKRPGVAHVDAEFGNLVRELVEKKHHIYLDQNPTSVLRGGPGAVAAQAAGANDLFLTLRMWDSKLNRPRDVRDVSVPSTMTIADLKASLHAEGILPCAPEKMFLVEEETDLRTNILATDAMSISMCGIISGDILHLEEITEDKLDATNQIVHSWTGSFLANRPVTISVQETEDSFHRRRGRLNFLSDTTFKFELKLKASWSFSKLKYRIARRVGISPEYLKISTRVEPQVHLHTIGANNPTAQSAVDVIGGNLWLLLDIDSTEILAEKIPISVHHFTRSGLCTSVQTILVRKTTNIKGLKERIAETLNIPEELQLISRLASRDLAAASYVSHSALPMAATSAAMRGIDRNAPVFVRQVYTQNSLKLSQLNLHHIRVDEMERPVGENDLILQTIRFSAWKSGYKPCASTQGTVRLIALPAGSKFNEVKAAIASNSSDPVDIDTMTLKLAGCATLQKDLMFDIKPKYFEDQSTVVASTLMRPLDIVCWSDEHF